MDRVRVIYSPVGSVDIHFCGRCRSMLNFAGLCQCRGHEFDRTEEKTVSVDEFGAMVREAQNGSRPSQA